MSETNIMIPAIISISIIILFFVVGMSLQHSHANDFCSKKGMGYTVYNSTFFCLEKEKSFELVCNTLINKCYFVSTHESDSK